MARLLQDTLSNIAGPNKVQYYLGIICTVQYFGLMFCWMCKIFFLLTKGLQEGSRDIMTNTCAWPCPATPPRTRKKKKLRSTSGVRKLLPWYPMTLPSRKACALHSSSFARLLLWCDANLQSLVSLDTKLIGKIPQQTDLLCLQRLKGHPGAVSKAIFQGLYFRHS